jgi:prepilin-type N-terminal cleavage/methylation domain-containing protein/prepilin-type processing-associated H-X9-DG protein
MKNVPHDRGFSLVELLVVIGIIGILLGTLIPSLRAVRRHSRQVACAANLRTIGQLIQLYAGQNDGRIPHAPPGPDVATSRLWNGNSFTWGGQAWQPQYAGLGLLMPQRGSDGREIFFCPTDAGYRLDEQGPAIGVTGQHAFGSYLYRQLEAVGDLARGNGRIDQLGHLEFTPLTGDLQRIQVQVLALDRNYAGALGLLASTPPGKPAVNHSNAQVNVLYVDGAVETFDNEAQSLPGVLVPPPPQSTSRMPWASIPASAIGNGPKMRHHLQRVLVAADYSRFGEPWQAPVPPAPPAPGMIPF